VDCPQYENLTPSNFTPQTSHLKLQLHNLSTNKKDAAIESAKVRARRNAQPIHCPNVSIVSSLQGIEVCLVANEFRNGRDGDTAMVMVMPRA
jgi:hypothetical protein